MAKESNYWRAILRDAASRGYPVGGLLEEAEAVHQGALRLAALLNDEKLYAVELRYEGIRKKDDDGALMAAFGGDGDLVEERVEVAEDPSEMIENLDPWAIGDQEEAA